MLDFIKPQNWFDPVKSLKKQVNAINLLESRFTSLSTAALNSYANDLKERVKKGESLDSLLPEAFALVRETSKRTLGQRHFDVQLIGGLVLHQGKIAEMMTGEGKTLTSTAPIFLNALSGQGVHVVTVNEYLAKRDTVWMGQIYHSLGLKVACLVHEGALMYDPDFRIKETDKEIQDENRDLTGSFVVHDDYLKPVSRANAYAADITYGTNHEFGFDYLRDNLAQSRDHQVQRPYHFALIDEIDSVLIDEARTPLIISAPDKESSDYYKKFAEVVSRLQPETDYVVDEKFKSVSITDAGIEKVEKMIDVSNLYASTHLRLVHYLEESLKAKALFHLDRDYVIKDGAVIIVDQFTGRLMPGRRFSGGLHQAIEAKEGVLVKEESRTYAKVSIQNYFKMYPKLAGMTGTASTSAEEFRQVYRLDVVSIPTNQPVARVDLPDAIYRNFNAKMNAIINRIKKAQADGQPVLIGTTSIEKNELMDRILSQNGIIHETLNAKNHEREGQIIAQAGRPSAVTLATNMAGRGVDIVLGGNPPTQVEADKVRAAGGLLVIGTERHEARRIDNQLRGRSGRQGDPGASQFFLSLDDDLLRIFGGERIQSLMERFDFPEDQPIEMNMVSRTVLSAQKKVEGFHFDSRKHLLQYDDVLNKQRHSVYKIRQQLLNLDGDEVVKTKLDSILLEAVTDFTSIIANRSLEDKDKIELISFLKNTAIFTASEITELSSLIHTAASGGDLSRHLSIRLPEIIKDRTKSITSDSLLKNRLLSILDMLWMNHLDDMEALQESVRLRAYGQKDPLIEFRKEAHGLFHNLFRNFRGWVFENIFRLSRASTVDESSHTDQTATINIPVSANSPSADPKFKNVGRNDPCPCGSGKKFKKCHGK